MGMARRTWSFLKLRAARQGAFAGFSGTALRWGVELPPILFRKPETIACKRWMQAEARHSMRREPSHRWQCFTPEAMNRFGHETALPPAQARGAASNSTMRAAVAAARWAAWVITVEMA